MNLKGLLIIFTFLFHLSFCISSFSQNVEKVYSENIQTAQLYNYGNPQSLPVYTLGSNELMELGFDDMDADVKSYYYSFVLCDYNWQPVDVTPFDYIKGFTQNRINTYRYSSIAYTRYTHYQAFLPDRNSLPTKSGNYLLKVFLNGDTSQLAFTKQMLVLDPKTAVSAMVLQPYSPKYFTSHQKLKFSINITGLNSFSPAQQIKVVILQNNRWDIAQKDIAPTFTRGNSLEYDSENIGFFPGGKEWRWLDLRSLRLQSDRIESGSYKNNISEFFLKTDVDRTAHKYIYYPDYNGMYNIVTYETINPLWQGDYATVHFYLAPSDVLYDGKKNVYLAGQFTGYELSDKWKMKMDSATGKYTNTAFLKQGYYNYEYIIRDENDTALISTLEGNYWETENSYTILVYYKSFTDRSDQLIGMSRINSRNDKPGFSF